MAAAAHLGFIVENIGVGEIVVIAFLALVVLGPDRIPEMARGAGRMLHNAKKFTGNLTSDMGDVINDPAMQPIRELGEFATRPRQKLAEYALEAEAEERQRKADESVRASAEAAGTAATPDDEQPTPDDEHPAPDDDQAPAEEQPVSTEVVEHEVDPVDDAGAKETP